MLRLRTLNLKMAWPYVRCSFELLDQAHHNCLTFYTSLKRPSAASPRAVFQDAALTLPWTTYVKKTAYYYMRDRSPAHRSRSSRSSAHRSRSPIPRARPTRADHLKPKPHVSPPPPPGRRRHGLEPKVIHALVAFFRYRQNKAQPKWNHLKSAMDQLYIQVTQLHYILLR